MDRRTDEGVGKKFLYNKKGTHNTIMKTRISRTMTMRMTVVIIVAFVEAHYMSVTILIICSLDSDTGRLRCNSKNLEEFCSHGFIFHSAVRSEVIC